MKKISIFFIICAAIFQFQISAAYKDTTKEEWKKFQNGSIVEQIPGLDEELLLLPTTGLLRNPLLMYDSFSFSISSAYMRRLQPIIESYNAEHHPGFISEGLKEPFSNCFFQDLPNHSTFPHTEVISKAEFNALQVFGIDIGKAINASNNSYDFYVKELRISLIRDYIGVPVKFYNLIIESPDLDAFRESLGLPKQSYTIVLFCERLKT